MTTATRRLHIGILMVKEGAQRDQCHVQSDPVYITPVHVYTMHCMLYVR